MARADCSRFNQRMWFTPHCSSKHGWIWVSCLDPLIQKANMKTYALYSTSIQDNAASVVIAKAGRIKSIRTAARFDTAADNSYCDIEVSLNPVSQMAVNDSRGVLDISRFANNLATSGMAVSCVNKQALVDVPVGAGEKIYMNTAASTTTFTANVLVDIEE